MAAETAARSLAPAIVYRPLAVPQPGADRPVLIGVTGRPGEQPLLAFAFEEAELRGCALVASYVAPGSGSVAPANLLAEALGPWPAKYPDVEVRPQVRPGTDVADALCAASTLAWLTVVGADGRRGSRGHGLGPVSRALIERAGCPVAVVPDTPLR